MFFYQLVYDPNQKTLNVDRGEIRVGGKYQADVPTQPFYTNGIQEGIEIKFDIEEYLYIYIFFNKENPQSRENLIWDCNGGLTEKQVEQFLIVARYEFIF